MKIYCICINEVVMVSSHQNQLKNCQIGQCSKKRSLTTIANSAEPYCAIFRVLIFQSIIL